VIGGRVFAGELPVEIFGGAVGLVALLVGGEVMAIDEGLRAAAREHFLVAYERATEIALVGAAGVAEIEDVGLGPEGVEAFGGWRHEEGELFEGWVRGGWLRGEAEREAGSWVGLLRRESGDVGGEGEDFFLEAGNRGRNSKWQIFKGPNLRIGSRSRE